MKAIFKDYDSETYDMENGFFITVERCSCGSRYYHVALHNPESYKALATRCSYSKAMDFVKEYEREHKK